MRMISLIIFLIVFASCSLIQSNQGIREAESNKILFILFNIHKDTLQRKNIVEMLSKTEAAGKIKSQTKNLIPTTNYLSVYLFYQKTLLDSITIEHPLYKHLEYIDEKGKFAAKDTVLDKADFVLRFQAKGKLTEMRIFEKLKDRSVTALSIIKL